MRKLFVHVPDTNFGRTASAVSRDEVRRFSTAARGAWRSIARAVALFVVSPIPVVLLIAGADEGLIPANGQVAIAAGLGLLLLITAVGALQLLQASTALAPFRFLRQKQVPAGGDAAGWVERIARAQRQHRAVIVGSAVVLWISSPLPLIIVALSDPSTFPGIWIAAATTFLLVAVACGLFAVLRTAWPSYVAGKLTTGVGRNTVG